MSEHALRSRILPSPISKSDRSLIEQHIATNGITQCARGESGFRDEDYAIGGKANRNQFGAGRKPDLKKQARYRALVAEDKTVAEIAEAMGVTLSGANSALSNLKLKAASARRVGGKHDARIRQMCADDLTVRQIAERLGMTIGGASAVCRRLKVEPKRGQAKHGEKSAACRSSDVPICFVEH